MHTSNSGKPKPQFTINQKHYVVQKVVAHQAKCPGMSLSLRLSSMALDQYPIRMVLNWLAQKDDLATAVMAGCGSKHTLSIHVKRKMQSLDGSGTNDAEAKTKKKAKGMMKCKLGSDELHDTKEQLKEMKKLVALREDEIIQLKTDIQHKNEEIRKKDVEIASLKESLKEPDTVGLTFGESEPASKRPRTGDDTNANTYEVQF